MIMILNKECWNILICAHTELGGEGGHAEGARGTRGEGAWLGHWLGHITCRTSSEWVCVVYCTELPLSIHWTEETVYEVEVKSFISNMGDTEQQEKYVDWLVTVRLEFEHTYSELVSRTIVGLGTHLQMSTVFCKLLPLKLCTFTLIQCSTTIHF